MRGRHLAALLSLSAFVFTPIAAAGQTRPTQQPATKYQPPRTPWGHADLQGTYSNDDETGPPMARPAQFAGRTIESFTREEMQALNKTRNEQFTDSVSGEEFAGGLRPPAHLIFDTFDRKHKRPWLIIDPPDGQQPPRVQAAGGRGGRGGGRGAGGAQIAQCDNADQLSIFDDWQAAHVALLHQALGLGQRQCRSDDNRWSAHPVRNAVGVHVMPPLKLARL